MFLEGRPIAEGTGHREGRRLLAQMYRQHVGGELPPIALEERGKPYFTQGPWHFSISHTDRHVFCALSKSRVGDRKSVV